MEGFNKKRRIDVEGESDIRPWDELIPDALGLILKNLNLQEVLQVVPRVCKSWYKVVEGPCCCWQRIDIDDWRFRYAWSSKTVDRMLRMLVSRSSGSLRELNVSSITDDQMLVIAEHAGSLETLTIRRSSISCSMFEHVASKLSSLTTLDLSYGCEISARALEAIGTNCKALSSLTCNALPIWSPEFDDPPRPSHADAGRAIARTMPKLKHLSIAAMNFDTDIALEILSGCPELESLNIKGCWRVYFGANLLEEKYPKIKVVPVEEEDSYDDYGWDTWNSALWLWMIEAG